MAPKLRLIAAGVAAGFVVLRWLAASAAAQPELHPSLFYGYSYGTGLEAAPGVDANSVVQTVAPAIAANFGTHWSLSYAPTWRFYSSPDFRNSVDQTANLAATASCQDWQFQLSQGYVSSSDPTIATGGQTPQQSYATSLGATESLGRSLELDLGAQQLFQTVGGAEPVAAQVPYPASAIAYDGWIWSTQDSLRFLVSPKFNFSLGLRSSYDDEVGITRLASGGPMAAISWQATPKTKFELQGGVQREEILSAPRSDMTVPNILASLRFVPLDGTTIALSADHDLGFSLLTDQTLLTTKADAAVEQRLWKHFVFTAGMEAGQFKYVSPAANFYPDRTDRIRSYNLGFGTTTFLRRITIMILYQSTHDASTAAGYGDSGRQIGFQIGYRY